MQVPEFNDEFFLALDLPTVTKEGTNQEYIGMSGNLSSRTQKQTSLNKENSSKNFTPTLDSILGPLFIRSEKTTKTSSQKTISPRKTRKVPRSISINA